MRLLPVLFGIVAAVIAGLALLLGAAMVEAPERVQEGLLLLVLLSALAAACVAVALRLRRDNKEAEACDDSAEDEEREW